MRYKLYILPFPFTVHSFRLMSAVCMEFVLSLMRFTEYSYILHFSPLSKPDGLNL